MSHIYLAGPITGLTYESANDWRSAWAPRFEEIGHTTASPLRGKEALRGKGVLSGVFDEGKAAVMRDLYDIRHADIVLANFEDAKIPSIGTIAEIGYAFAYNRFILTVMSDPEAAEMATLGTNPPRPDHNPHDHIFITEMSSVILPSMSEAFDWVRVMD